MHPTSANKNTFLGSSNRVPLHLFHSYSYWELPLYMRLFITLFPRIDYNDLNKELFVPIVELMPSQGDFLIRVEGTDQLLAELYKGMRRMHLHVEAFEDEHRQRLDKPVVTKIKLTRLVRYDDQQGGVRVKLNKNMLPYLLQVYQGGNYLQDDITFLLQVESRYALGVYWFLKELSDLGLHPTPSDHPPLDEQAEDLKKPCGQHGTLDETSQVLKHSDIFVYEWQRAGQTIKRLKFVFPSYYTKTQKAAIVARHQAAVSKTFPS
jgi:hypothetical protein